MHDNRVSRFNQIIGESNKAPEEPHAFLGEQAHSQDEEKW